MAQLIRRPQFSFCTAEEAMRLTRVPFREYAVATLSDGAIRLVRCVDFVPRSIREPDLGRRALIAGLSERSRPEPSGPPCDACGEPMDGEGYPAGEHTVCASCSSYLDDVIERAVRSIREDGYGGEIYMGGDI